MSPKKGRRSNGEGWLSWREDRLRWVAQYVVNNFTPKRRRITRSFKTEREALSYLARLRTQLEQGLDAPDNQVTVNDIVDYWLNEIVEHSKLADNTKSSYRENAELHVKPALGTVKLVKLRYEHVQAFINAKRDEGYSKSSMKSMMIVMRRALDQAMAMEKLNRNVARSVRIPEPRKPKEKVRGWKPDEAAAFLDAAANHELFTLFVLAAMVGPRRGEVLGLKWSDLDSDKKTLRIERQVLRIKGMDGLQIRPPKGGKTRTIHLPQQCIDLLLEHKDAQAKQREEAGERWRENGIIFTTEIGTWIEPRKINTWMEELTKEAKLETAGLHKLRHTAATIARRLGVDWKEIQAMLGHASAQITQDIYVDDIQEFQEAAADAIDKGFVIMRPTDEAKKQAKEQSSSKSSSPKPKRTEPAPRGRLPGGRNAV